MISKNTQNKIDTKWLENLAQDEVNMEESGIINFTEHLDTNSLLEESSIEFVESLKEKFEVLSHQFNQLRGQSNLNKLIKFFKISNTVNDFMLYRNSLKLIIARRSVDVISIGFLNNAGQVFGSRLEGLGQSSKKLHEIKAHIGAFNEVTWRYQGQIVNQDILVKHYLSEFIKNSSK